MIETFDFVFSARRQGQFMNALKQAMVHDTTTVLYSEKHMLSFDPSSRTININSNFSDAVKIVPAKITYEALTKMLDGNWDSFNEGDIVYAE